MNEHISQLETLPYLNALLEKKERQEGLPAFPVVLDTNILLDWFYWDNEDVLLLINRLKEKKATFIASRETLEEFADILARPQFAIDPKRQKEILASYVSEITLADLPTNHRVRCKDKDDEKFLALAYAVKAKLLLSRDKAVLKAGKKLRASNLFVLNPERALEYSLS